MYVEQDSEINHYVERNCTTHIKYIYLTWSI